MNLFEKHEIFEIEFLSCLKNRNFLSPLVFVGGTMLRLCYDLNRYSSDLDFWFVRKVDYEAYFLKLRGVLEELYELTDAQLKHSTLVLEIKSENFPRKLKLEIRKGVKKCDYQEIIAFSKFSNKQVILKALTSEEALKSKVEAALSRKDIRDFYDIEFLLVHGASLDVNLETLNKLKAIALNFKDREFKVTLGSVLESDVRKYYVENKFGYLLRKIEGDLSFKIEKEK